jgi:SDR family mycofactocin-dependent oxidoreductase
MGKLDGKVAFVTGAGHGQGRSHAVRLAGEGADVILLDICHDIDTIGYGMSNEAELEETAKLVEKEGRRAVFGKADVAKFDEVKRVFDEGLAELGRIDIVVANAGILSFGLTWEITDEQWDDVLAVNLKGPWNTARVAIPTMIEQGSGGSIIMTSSSAGLRAAALMAHYTASKHGVVGLARTLAVELGQYDIRVNTVHPCGVATAMASDPRIPEFFMKFPELFGPLGENLLPTPGGIEANDVSDAVVWLASPEARNITGIQLPVDKGQTARS